MSKQLISIKNTFFDKIKSFFRNLFGKNKSQNIKNENIDQNISENKDFEQTIKINLDEIKPDINNMTEDDLVKQVERNPEILKGLSTDRLLAFEKYVDDEIKQYEEKIKKLKSVS